MGLSLYGNYITCMKNFLKAHDRRHGSFVSVGQQASVELPQGRPGKEQQEGVSRETTAEIRQVTHFQVVFNIPAG